MLKLICELIIMSVSGAVMYALSLLFKGKKHAVARYAMLIAAVVIMLLPFNAAGSAPKIFNVELARETVSGTGYAMQVQTGVSFSDIMVAAVFFVWLTGAVVSGIGVIRDYIRTSHVIKRVSKKTLDGRIIGIYKSVCGLLSVRQSVDIYVSSHLKSPLLFGVLKPRMIIPEREFTDEELEMIMAHELVHYKHRDLWIAIAAAAVRCVHWFNPCSYMLSAAIMETRELCCDETVLELIRPQDKEGIRTCYHFCDRGRHKRRTCVYDRNGVTEKVHQKAARQDRVFQKAIEDSQDSEHGGGLRLRGGITYGIWFYTGCRSGADRDNAPYGGGGKPPVNSGSPAPTAAPEPEETYLPEETELPETSEESPAATETVTEEEQIIIAEEMSEGQAPVETEQSVYTFEMEADEPEMKTDAPEQDEYEFTEESGPVAAEPKTFVLPESAYIFTPDLSEGVEVRSDNFYASEDIKLSVTKNSDNTVRLYDAEGDRLIYEDDADSYRGSFSLDMPEGSTYYVTVTPGRNKPISVYIKAI